METRQYFHKGGKIDREIFAMPPKEANTTSIWKLKKCIYGLNDALRKRYN